MAASTRIESSKQTGTLYLALELSLGKWDLGFTIGLGQKPRRRSVSGGDVEGLEMEIEMVRQLLCLRGLGINSAWLYVMEFFGWRRFRNRKQVGSLAGLTPMPYQSGGSRREQGISKAGNRLVRAMTVEIAWGWLRFQPTSKLSRWYQERFGHGGRRARKIGIVALARKLLVELWKYLETGVIPEGAVVTA